MLWKVNVPDNDATVDQLVFEDNPAKGIQKLRPSWIIGEHFPTQPKGYIHVVVTYPVVDSPPETRVSSVDTFDYAVRILWAYQCQYSRFYQNGEL